MKRVTTKFLLAGIVLVAITIVISRCKSADEKSAEVVTTTIDTAAILTEVEADTFAIEVADETDATVTVADVKDTTAKAAKPKVIQKPLTITIQNLASTTAPVYISVYGTKSKFPDPKGQLKEYKFKAHGKELTVQIPNLKFGTYAIASYQDVNSDGKIDKNMIGIPTEGFGFSNNYKPTVKAPKFKDCSFIYSAKNNAITIKMIQ